MTKASAFNFLRFPLGNLLKNETRDIARKLDLNVADKPDSQDICFVPNGDYASVIQKFHFQILVYLLTNSNLLKRYFSFLNFLLAQR